jgi:hypothetical protein
LLLSSSVLSTFKDLIDHPELAIRIELFLRQEEAVLAIQVAASAGRFRHDRECCGIYQRYRFLLHVTSIRPTRVVLLSKDHGE